MGTQPTPDANPARPDASDTSPAGGTSPAGPVPPAARHRRDHSTLVVALTLLAALLGTAIISDPESVLPKDSTILVERYDDDTAGISIPIPVGWTPSQQPDFGSTELVPSAGQSNYKAEILAGTLSPDIPAAAIVDDHGAATALAETIAAYVLGAQGWRDETRNVAVDNKVGSGRATSYILRSSTDGRERSWLVYVAVFGPGYQRKWLAYLSETPTDAPQPRWVDRIVHDIRPIDSGDDK